MLYTISLDRSGIAIIGEALGGLPHKQVAGLIGSIQQQINAQEAGAQREQGERERTAKADAQELAAFRAAAARQ
jgi:hypothetical protein